MQSIEKRTNVRCFFGHLKVFDLRLKIFLLQIKIAKRFFKEIACENCARQVRLSRFPLMQKFEKNQRKINFWHLWGHLTILKFLINFCTMLKVLLRSNFLLLLCSKTKTKKIFTPRYCTVFIHTSTNKCKKSKLFFIYKVNFWPGDSERYLRGLRVKLPLVLLSTTHIGSFTLSFLLLSIKQESCEYQRLWFE